MKNQKNIKISLVCILVSLTMLGNVVPAMAESGVSSIDAEYKDINVIYGGCSVDLRGAKPAVIDGTVYLPLRAISNTMGIDVTWDKKTNYVYLGDVPVYVKIEDDTKENSVEYSDDGLFLEPSNAIVFCYDNILSTKNMVVRKPDINYITFQYFNTSKEHENFMSIVKAMENQDETKRMDSIYKLAELYKDMVKKVPNDKANIMTGVNQFVYYMSEIMYQISLLSAENQYATAVKISEVIHQAGIHALAVENHQINGQVIYFARFYNLRYLDKTERFLKMSVFHHLFNGQQQKYRGKTLDEYIAICKQEQAEGDARVKAGHQKWLEEQEQKK